MTVRQKYPPCVPGLFSEKPRRHKFEIVLDSEERPVLKLDPVTGATLYHVRCKYCGLNDPSRVLH